MADTVIQRAFSAGELSPSLGARADLKTYVTGLARCQNLYVKREGGLLNRPGWRFVQLTKFPERQCRLIPFVFEAANQTYVIEFGDFYARFYWHGGIVLDPVTSQPYELATPYAAAEVDQIQYAQLTDTLVLVHALHPPMELRRAAHTNWLLASIVTAASIPTPTGLAGSASAAGTRTIRYVVTAWKKVTGEESQASAVLTIGGALGGSVETPQVIGWVAVVDDNGEPPEEYHVYQDPYNNGTFGYIGSTKNTTFYDAGFAADFAVSPPLPRTLFNQPGDYPSVVSYYQQRLFFANTINKPENVWGSRVGAFHNFSTSIPLQDDDGIEFVIASRELNPVRHLIPMKRLLLLSDEAEWLLRGDDNNGTIIPTSINADYMGGVGANFVRPIIAGGSLIYVQTRGAIIRDLQLTTDDLLGGADITLGSSHLFEGRKIVAMAWQQQPHYVLWVARDDGRFLSATYSKAENVLAWAQHETDGIVEELVSVPDTPLGEDVVYSVIQRLVGGTPVRYIERLESRLVYRTDLHTKWLTSFFVDSGLTYDGPPVATITGLQHLEGRVVAVVADGVVLYDGDPDGVHAAEYTVTAGEVHLTDATGAPVSAQIVHAGLAIPHAELQTLALDAEGTGMRDRKKKVQGVTVSVLDSEPLILMGPDAAHLVRSKRDGWDPQTGELTKAVETNIDANWSTDGQVFIRHTQPTALEVLAVMPKVEAGG